MPFSSLTFLFLFLPLVLGTYFAVPARFRNAVLLIASSLFFVWGAPQFLAVLIAISLVDYRLSHWLVPRKRPRFRRGPLLTLGIAFNLGVLIYFKYANFFVQQCNLVLAARHYHPFAWTEVALPIGVSFIVFEEISYLVDVYRGEAEPAKRFFDYLLYLCLFPHAVSGPIFRWRQMASQFAERAVVPEAIWSGAQRFALGLGKKVLIADAMAMVADAAFAASANHLPWLQEWAGIVAYALQIYFDFSGYSDMAIGLGRVFGFTFQENFDRPYSATSISDFWRRWHISLSSWLRDYVYIPLGGGRASNLRVTFNTLFVFLLCGFWHGANWTFVVWGVYHGVLVAGERWLRKLPLPELPKPLRIALTFSLTTLGWIWFRATSLADAQVYFGKLLPHPIDITQISPWSQLVPGQPFWLGCLSLVAVLIPTETWRDLRKAIDVPKWAPNARLAAQFTGVLLLVSLAAMTLVSSTFHPFIYFRF